MNNPIELHARWTATVIRGDADHPTQGPVVRQSVVPPEDENNEQALWPDGLLVYSPVAIRSIGRTLVIETQAVAAEGGAVRHSIHREMTWTDIEFDWFGHIRLEGFETRKDGVLVAATWEVEPHGGDT